MVLYKVFLKVFLIVILAIISLSDFIKYRIPNILLLLMASISLIFNFDHIIPNALAALFSFLIFLSVYMSKGGLGFGDVKLACVIAFVLGFFGFIFSALCGTIMAIIYAVSVYFIQRTKQQNNCISFAKMKIPYGTFLSISAIPFILIGNL